ncbi:MAG: hypothetical protein ING95_15995 [Roseomonas sp.]|jgi:hypothetical protein|nr:hypothetical protein [Roseomonas sp.]
MSVTVDEEVCAAFDRAVPQRLEDLGGVEMFRGREESVARASLMPEILRLAVAELSAGISDPALDNFIVACAAVPVGEDVVVPSAYRDAMLALASAALSEELAERCQVVLVGRIPNRRENEVARWAALGAALQIALVYPDLRHSLIGVLVRLKRDGNPPEFLRRAAKVVGIAHSHWQDASLAAVLVHLADEPIARDEALFELGMSALRDGLDADVAGAVDKCFDEARRYFDASLLAREHRPDALVYSRTLSMLTALRRGDAADGLRRQAEGVRREVTLARAWSGSTNSAWGWMGARWSELIRWQDLAGHLGDIEAATEAAVKAGAELAIRERLLGAYVANRAVLGRRAGGVETFITPHIAGGLLRQETGREITMAWLAQEQALPSSPWKEAAAELLEDMRARGSPEGKRMGAAHTA